MTDEDRQRTMDFILEQQVQFTVSVELLRQRVETLTTNVEGLREAQARTDAAVGALIISCKTLHVSKHISMKLSQLSQTPNSTPMND